MVGKDSFSHGSVLGRDVWLSDVVRKAVGGLCGCLGSVDTWEV